jgi:hypothetical protein
MCLAYHERGFVHRFKSLPGGPLAFRWPLSRCAAGGVTIGIMQTAQRMDDAWTVIGAPAPMVGLRNAFRGLRILRGRVRGPVLYRDPPRAAPAGERRPRTPFASILAFENFVLVMLVLFGLQLLDRSFGPVLPLYLGEIGYSPGEVPVMAGILFSVLAFTAALGNQLSGRVLKRHSPRTVIAWAVVVASAALAVFTVSTAVWLLAVSMAGGLIGTPITTAFRPEGGHSGMSSHRLVPDRTSPSAWR